MEGQQTSLLGNPKATGSVSRTAVCNNVVCPGGRGLKPWLPPCCLPLMQDRAKAKEDRSFAYDHSFWSLNPKDKHFATQVNSFSLFPPRTGHRIAVVSPIVGMVVARPRVWFLLRSLHVLRSAGRTRASAGRGGWCVIHRPGCC